MFRHSSPHPALRATLSRSRAVQIKNGQSAETPDQRGLHSSHPLRGAVLETIASPGLARFARSPLAILLAALQPANSACLPRALEFGHFAHALLMAVLRYLLKFGFCPTSLVSCYIAGQFSWR